MQVNLDYADEFGTHETGLFNLLSADLKSVRSLSVLLILSQPK